MYSLYPVVEKHFAYPQHTGCPIPQVLSKNALAGVNGDPEMGLEHMTKDAIKVTFKCTVCGQEGKGKVRMPHPNQVLY